VTTRSHRLVVVAAMLLWLCTMGAPAHADIWILEPSISLDQRFDDNYRIKPTRIRGDDNATVSQPKEPVNSTRLVGALGLSRESPIYSMTGGIRIDGLLTQSDFESEGLSSNQLLFLESSVNKERSIYGIDLYYKQDSPSRDIAADITDLGETASDTGAATTQGNTVGRTRREIRPHWTYKLTRRTRVDADLAYTKVKHDLASVSDLRSERFLSIPEDQRPDTPNDLGPFRVDDELDDYREAEASLGFRYQLSPISAITFSGGYSDYSTHVEIDQNNFVAIPFNAEVPDSRSADIRRLPRRERQSITTKFRLGYERDISPTLNVGVEVGYFSTDTDNTDLYRESGDNVPEEDRLILNDVGRAELLEEGATTELGYLTNVTVRKDAGVTQYALRTGIDVQPSDVGSQVEAFEAIGDIERVLTPLLDFSFRVRLFEPDSFNSSGDDEFKRRFLSFEPKLIWRFSRAWSVAGSYRYRRQKSQTATESGESNALLFSLKYTPPSALRDASRNR